MRRRPRALEAGDLGPWDGFEAGRDMGGTWRLDLVTTGIGRRSPEDGGTGGWSPSISAELPDPPDGALVDPVDEGRGAFIDRRES